MEENGEVKAMAIQRDRSQKWTKILIRNNDDQLEGKGKVKEVATQLRKTYTKNYHKHWLEWQEVMMVMMTKMRKEKLKKWLHRAKKLTKILIKENNDDNDDELDEKGEAEEVPSLQPTKTWAKK